jgi:DNA-binding phage protein
MDASDAIRTMIKASGKSARQVSREIDRAETFISASLAQSTCPRSDTLVKIADACGYKIVALPAEEANKLSSESNAINIEYGDI